MKILENGVVRDATPEELAQAQIDVQSAEVQRIEQVRSDRNQRLAASDWVVARAFETNTAVPQAWASYRQALRDVPQQAGFPDNIQWPVKPE